MLGTMATPPIGDMVRALRKELGLTQEALADRAGLQRTRVVRIESDAEKGSSPNVRRGLATAFGLSLDDLDLYLRGELSLPGAVRRARPKAA